MSYRIYNLICVLITGMHLKKLDFNRATNQWDDPAAKVFARLFVEAEDDFVGLNQSTEGMRGTTEQ